MHTLVSCKSPTKTILYLARPKHLQNISNTKVRSMWFMEMRQTVNSTLGCFSRARQILCQSGTSTGNRALNFKIKKLYIAAPQLLPTTTLISTAMQIVLQTAMYLQPLMRFSTSKGLVACTTASVNCSTKLLNHPMSFKVVLKQVNTKAILTPQ